MDWCRVFVYRRDSFGIKYNGIKSFKSADVVSGLRFGFQGGFKGFAVRSDSLRNCIGCVIRCRSNSVMLIFGGRGCRLDTT